MGPRSRGTGSRGWDLTTGGGGQAGEIELNGVPAQYLSTSRVRDQATINFLTAQVPNPFRGLLPGTSFNGATIARQQLLRPFPQFDNIQTRASDGTSRYNSAQFKLEKRFTSGYSLLAAYTWSKFTERVFKLNPTDTEYEERLSEFDVPHRLAMSGIYEILRQRPPLGFGCVRCRRSARRRMEHPGDRSAADRTADQLPRPQHLFRRRSEQPEDGLFGRYEPAGVRHQRFLFQRCRGADQRSGEPGVAAGRSAYPAGEPPRYFPSRVPGLRGHGLNLWDISVVKQLRFTDRFRGQFHVELINAFNRAGLQQSEHRSAQRGVRQGHEPGDLPRDIQIALKLVF